MHKPFLFFGTPSVARDTLAALVEAGYRPLAVVTAPDAPRGRGHVLTPCETKAWALENELEVLAPEKLDAATIDTLLGYKAEYALVVAYGKIMPRRLIESFPLGALNVHYSLLPKYRGASPVESALLHDESSTGVSIQQMVYELDAGDVIACQETAIDSNETTRELRPRLIKIGAELLIKTLPSFEAGTVTRTKQDESLATHCGKIKKEEGLLDLSGDAKLNWSKYRAYAQSPGTYFFTADGKRVKIKTAKFERSVFTPLRVVPEGKSETDYKA